MIQVRIPNYCVTEQNYILGVLLGEFLGLEYQVVEHDGLHVEIAKIDSATKLTLDTSFFNSASQGDWLKSESMPILPLQTWNPADDGLHVDLVEEILPVLYGKAGLVKNSNHWHLNVDIFGAAFFMLSRYEELITQDRDQHDRFPATASVAFKANFLDRPIVNEYLEVLWECMRSLWPELKREKRYFKKVITCDVDFPYDLVARSLSKTIVRVGARVVRDRSYCVALKDGVNYITSKFGCYFFDNYYNNLKWIMDTNEKAGNKVAFYFIPKITSEEFDCQSLISQPRVRKLLKEMNDRGHEIGFHPGYMTYQSDSAFHESSQFLRQTLGEEGIVQSNIGGRQHYLRWDASRTPMLWESAGYDYDSTLSYADKVGFRCGVCYEYNMYDLVNRKSLKLKQRPLIVMDASVISHKYEGLGYTDEALSRCLYFKNIVRKYSGDFVLLWHNTSFTSVKSKIIYQELI